MVNALRSVPCVLGAQWWGGVSGCPRRLRAECEHGGLHGWWRRGVTCTEGPPGHGQRVGRARSGNG